MINNALASESSKSLGCQVLETGLSINQIQQLKEQVRERAGHARVHNQSAYRQAPEYRASDIYWISPDENKCLYELIWDLAVEANKQFQLDIVGMSDMLQLAIYRAEDNGHFSWHTDIGPSLWHRKISMSIPLSGPEEYQGGELEFMFSEKIYRPEQGAGVAIVFPSFALHRVTPVTVGERISLVAWVSGPEWQ